MIATRRVFTSGLIASVAAPALIRSAGAQGATVKIGMVVPITGPAAESGGFALTGAKIALEAVNKAGGVLGKQLELVTEDDQTTNPGAVLAFSKLASEPSIVAFLGSIRSTQMHAMAPDMMKAAKPVAFGGTDPNLTKLGNPWLFRFRPNDSYSGKRDRAVRFDQDARQEEMGGRPLDRRLRNRRSQGSRPTRFLKTGRPPFSTRAMPNQSQDFTPVVLAIRQSGADIIGSYFTFENDLGIFARQLRQLGVTIPWVGSPSIVNAVGAPARRPHAQRHLRRGRLRRGFERSRRRRSAKLVPGPVRKAIAGQPILLDLRRRDGARAWP